MIDDISQKRVIFSDVSESIYLNAPPGYGKTYTIIEKIKFIIKNQIIKPPCKILVLTFSNAAAAEMKSRLNQEIYNSEKYIDISNFHTFCYSILKNFGNYLNINRSFTILDERKKNTILTDLIKQNIKNGYIENQNISKVLSIYLEWYTEKYKKYNFDYISFYSEIFDSIHKNYNTISFSISKLDFDNLLFQTIRLLTIRPDLKTILHNKYRVICVDEFQDTNYIQYFLLKLIAFDQNEINTPIFCVGDKKQAIMKFQGANPKNIEYVIQDFHCSQFELEINHRISAKSIDIITKRLRNESINTKDKLLTLYLNIDNCNENDTIIREVKRMLDNGVKASEICIQYPQAYLSQNLEKELIKEKIPFLNLSNYRSDKIKDKYASFFNQVELDINNIGVKSSIFNYISILLKKYDDNSDEYQFFSLLLTNYAKIFDTGIFYQKPFSERLQSLYNYLHIDVNWTFQIKSLVKNRILISTIHGVKGLEFENVIIASLCNNYLPHNSICSKCSFEKKVDDAEDLLYVGISRAKNNCILSSFRLQSNTGNTYKIPCILKKIEDLIDYSNPNGDKISYSEIISQKLICNCE